MAIKGFSLVDYNFRCPFELQWWAFYLAIFRLLLDHFRQTLYSLTIDCN